MNIVQAMKSFFMKLTGVEPSGDTISDVFRSGATSVNVVNYETTGRTSFVLKSSTASSTKQFSITVNDSGNITATEID